MGWLCVIAFKPLIASLGFWGTFLLASGGVSYTVGALFYSIKSVRFMHVVWHLFVMLGAGLMYFFRSFGLHDPTRFYLNKAADTTYGCIQLPIYFFSAYYKTQTGADRYSFSSTTPSMTLSKCQFDQSISGK